MADGEGKTMNSEMKIDKAKAATIASGQFSGAAHMKKLLGDENPVAAKPQEKVMPANITNAASGQFSGAAFIKKMNGTDNPVHAQPKAKAAEPKDAQGKGEVPYGDERFIEGVVAQLGSE